MGADRTPGSGATPPAAVVTLGAGDEAVLEAFLAAHADSSMFLRSNLRAAGIVDGGARLQGTYVAHRAGDGRITGVAAQMWNGNLVLQAPAGAGTLAVQAVARGGRALRGLIGPAVQVDAARAALRVPHAAIAEASREGLFALDLARLVVPAPLRSGRVACRATTPADLARAAAWRVAYSIEVLGATAGPRLEASAAEDVAAAHRSGQSWMLFADGAPVAYAAYNAALPDVVQVGGVYTPLGLRGRGYARAVVAGALVAGRDTGVGRAVLFTGDDNLAARRAYAALGFRVVGDYALVLLRDDG